MKFVLNTALKNLRHKPLRACILGLIVLFLTLTLFIGGFVINSLQSGLSGYQERLGADIIVTPSSAQGHGTVDNVLLQGITGNYYLPAKSLDKLAEIEGIETMSSQFYLTSAKASCCSVRVQIIGFDPETDFSIQPWIAESVSQSIEDGDILIGSEVSMPADGKIKFYGKNYHVAAQLAKTGTGLDNAVYANMNTIVQMAQDASVGEEREAFRNIDIKKTASAILIKVKSGYDIQSVADDINIYIPKVKATPSQSMIATISDVLQGISLIIGLLTGGIWLLSVVIMIAVFVMLSHERKKEFAVMRVIGATRSMMLKIMGSEAGIVSIIGSLIGVLLSYILAFPVSEMIRSNLSMPVTMPDVGTLLWITAGAVLIPAAAGVITALISAVRITKSETGLLLREDA